jgi:hypothetical protein
MSSSWRSTGPATGTAMMGKYLNGYLESEGRSPVSSTYVPAGWSDWDIAGWGYPE